VELSNSATLNDKPDEPDALAVEMKEWLTTAEARSGGPARGSDGVRDPSDQYIGMARERTDFSATRAVEPSIDVSPRRSVVKNDQFTLQRPSIGKRMFHALARFFTVALLGVGATLAWQSHGEEATQFVSAWAPSLSGLVATLPTNSPRELGAAAELDGSTSAGQVSMQHGTLPRSAPVAQTASAAASSSELVPRIEEMARDLAAVRRGIEQLAVKQEQIAQKMATLEAAEQDIRQKMSTPPPSRVVPVPQRKNAPGAAPPQSAQSSSSQLPPVPAQAAPTRAPMPLR
jgi:hypothetical protein